MGAFATEETLAFALVEGHPIKDIYADGVADVELLAGGNVRLILFTWERGQRVIVARIVQPQASISGQATAMLKKKLAGTTRAAGYPGFAQ